MTISSESWFWTTATGERMFARSWVPSLRPRGLLVLIHGLGEHSGRYEELGDFFARLGWRVDAPDLPGHGQSAGQRGYARSVGDLSDFIGTFVTRQRMGGLPCFVYGNSMGAALALQLAVADRVLLTGVIASAPPIDVAQPVPGWKRWVAQILAPVAPRLPMNNGIRAELLCRNPQVVEAYRHDPLVHGRISISLGLDLLAWGTQIQAKAAAFSTPILLMHGDSDGIASFDASQGFCQSLGELCTWAPWPDDFHELHHEADWRRVAALAAGWMDDQILAAT